MFCTACGWDGIVTADLDEDGFPVSYSESCPGCGEDLNPNPDDDDPWLDDIDPMPDLELLEYGSRIS
jgi:hypothetical protein